MIEFVEKDFNIVSIKKESKLFNLATQYKYDVYGLRQEGNPPVLIEFLPSLGRDNNFVEKLNALVSFLKSNGIEVETHPTSNNNKIYIGLRRDLRAFVNKNNKPILSSSILSTIVYCLEGRVDLDSLIKYRLSNIPIINNPQSIGNNLQEPVASNVRPTNNIRFGRNRLVGIVLEENR